MKLSDKEYEQIKAWYCKYRGIKDESKCWNQTIIIGGKYTHSDIIEVLQDFFESSDIISDLYGKVLDQLEIIQCLTEENEMLKNGNYCNCKNNNYSYGIEGALRDLLDKTRKYLMWSFEEEKTALQESITNGYNVLSNGHS